MRIYVLLEGGRGGLGAQLSLSCALEKIPEPGMRLALTRNRYDRFGEQPRGDCVLLSQLPP
jgi:hypothetical protein